MEGADAAYFRKPRAAAVQGEKERRVSLDRSLVLGREAGSWRPDRAARRPGVSPVLPPRPRRTEAGVEAPEGWERDGTVRRLARPVWFGQDPPALSAAPAAGCRPF